MEVAEWRKKRRRWLIMMRKLTLDPDNYSIGDRGGREKRKSKSKSVNLLAVAAVVEIGGKGGKEKRKRKSVNLLAMVAAAAEIYGE